MTSIVIPQEVFFGITTNSLLLQRDDVPQCSLKAYKVLAKKVSACHATKGVAQIYRHCAASQLNIPVPHSCQIHQSMADMH